MGYTNLSRQNYRHTSTISQDKLILAISTTLYKDNGEISPNTTIVLRLKYNYSKLQIHFPLFKMKINEFWKCSPKISSIEPWIDLDRTSWSKLSGLKTHQNRGSVLELKDNRTELQILSPPFRLKINESWTSLPSFRSIGPQTKQDRTFDEIWTVKKKLSFSL